MKNMTNLAKKTSNQIEDDPVADAKQTFAANLRKIMDARNVSGKRLADSIGVGQSVVSRWRAGDAFPESQFLDALAHYFKCDLSEFLAKPETPIPVDPDEVRKTIEFLRKVLSSLDEKK